MLTLRIKALFIWAVIKYILLLPLDIAMTIIAVPMAFILPLFANHEGWLPTWLWWFQTPDNSLEGDGGWKTEHWQWRYKLPPILSIYVGRVGWLLRNRAYGFGDSVLGFKQDPSIPFYCIGNNYVSNMPYVPGWKLGLQGSAFEFYAVFPSFMSNDCCRVRIGWKLGQDAATSKDIATYVFYPINPFCKKSNS